MEEVAGNGSDVEGISDKKEMRKRLKCNSDYLILR